MVGIVLAIIVLVGIAALVAIPLFWMVVDGGEGTEETKAA
jgi:hypothetical protein